MIGDRPAVPCAGMPSDRLAPQLERFETRLASELRSSVAFIEAIGGDLAAAGGKRLRPRLAFLAAAALDLDDELGMRAALAVELLHSASLLHDDLIDDAETRRGYEAAFRHYGNVVSVMSGDYMLARVLGLLARSDAAAFTQLMSDTAARICEGEVLQFQMATLETWSFENYQLVIEGKTATLLAAACEGPALLADAAPSHRAALRTFGMAYGRAFQMRDDYLDLLGDPERMGKPVGGDLREGKATYPVLVAFDDPEVGEEALAIVRRHAAGDGDVERMRTLIRACGADERTRRAIEHEAKAASGALAQLPEGWARDELAALPPREIERLS